MVSSPKGLPRYIVHPKEKFYANNNNYVQNVPGKVRISEMGALERSRAPPRSVMLVIALVGVL